MNFNFIDILLVLIVLLSVWGGWRRGFILGFLDLIRWITSFLAALYFYQPLAEWLGLMTGWSQMWNQPLAFLLIVIIVGLIVQLLGNVLLKRISKDVHDHLVNRIFGILPGLANGLITAAIVSTLLFAVPFSEVISENVRESRIANRLAVYTEEIETALSPIFDKAVEQTLNRIIIKPESNERVELPFKVDAYRPRPELEAEMLKLVNRERIANKLAPLEADPELTEVARRHSADMFARGYFSHNTPENKTPFDRIRQSDVSFRTAGENLALAPTLQIAHTGLMNSPGHRANILQSNFGRLGIGVLDGGRRGLMITQNFRN
ncbi:MAG: CvpA family protein [Pyrinomonadaceae bacterium]|nr:CvpA family protein [Pyrinomonadaceae bacterium]